MNIPSKYREYPCEDYIAEGWSIRGHFSEPGQYWIVSPLAECHLEGTTELFAVGRAGSDGIAFGYRKEHAGLWAYYPISGEFLGSSAPRRVLPRPQEIEYPLAVVILDGLVSLMLLNWFSLPPLYAAFGSDRESGWFEFSA